MKLYYHLPEGLTDEERYSYVTHLLKGQEGERTPLLKLRDVRDENGEVVYKSLTINALTFPDAIAITPQGQEEYFTPWGFSLIFL